MKGDHYFCAKNKMPLKGLLYYIVTTYEIIRSEV